VNVQVIILKLRPGIYISDDFPKDGNDRSADLVVRTAFEIYKMIIFKTIIFKFRLNSPNLKGCCTLKINIKEVL
jgi:hypothetical protein